MGGKNDMKKKIIGILVFMLMIAATALPVAMSVNITMDKNNDDIIRTSDYVPNEEILDEIENTLNKKLIVNEIIGDRQVKYWEHVIDNFEIKNDYILLHHNVKDDEILKYEKN
jgi:uncharacterized protein YxeA